MSMSEIISSLPVMTSQRNALSEYGGQRHLRYIREHRKAIYTGLDLDGKLNSYLANLNEQAEDMFFRLVNELSEKEGITETLKAKDQMLWVRWMNAIRETATEIVNNDLIYA